MPRILLLASFLLGGTCCSQASLVNATSEGVSNDMNSGSGGQMIAYLSRPSPPPPVCPETCGRCV